jgi:hypothetical protein
MVRGINTYRRLHLIMAAATRRVLDLRIVDVIISTGNNVCGSSCVQRAVVASVGVSARGRFRF